MSSDCRRLGAGDALRVPGLGGTPGRGSAGEAARAGLAEAPSRDALPLPLAPACIDLVNRCQVQKGHKTSGAQYSVSFSLPHHRGTDILCGPVSLGRIWFTLL